jgi:hypothetical protein
MSHRRKEEHGKKLRRKGQKTEIDGDAQFSDDPHNVYEIIQEEENNRFKNVFTPSPQHVKDITENTVEDGS